MTRRSNRRSPRLNPEPPTTSAQELLRESQVTQQRYPLKRPELLKGAVEAQSKHSVLETRYRDIPPTAPLEYPSEESALGQISVAEFATLVWVMLEEDATITLQKIGTNIVMYKGVPINQFAQGNKPTGQQHGRLPVGMITQREMDEVTFSEEYKALRRELREMGYEGKKEYAIREGITWKRDDHPKIDNMHLTAAITRARHIVKYRPEYRGRKERKLLKQFGIFQKPLEKE